MQCSCQPPFCLLCAEHHTLSQELRTGNDAILYSRLFFWYKVSGSPGWPWTSDLPLPSAGSTGVSQHTEFHFVHLSWVSFTSGWFKTAEGPLRRRTPVLSDEEYSALPYRPSSCLQCKTYTCKSWPPCFWSIFFHRSQRHWPFLHWDVVSLQKTASQTNLGKRQTYFIYLSTK